MCPYFRSVLKLRSFNSPNSARSCHALLWAIVVFTRKITWLVGSAAQQHSSIVATEP